MSGTKRMTINTNEYHRLIQHEQQLRQIRRNLPEQINRSLRDIEQDLQRNISRQQDRQRQYEQALQNTNEEIRRIEKNAIDQIARNKEETRRKLEADIGSLRMETRQMIQEQQRRFDGLIRQEREVRQVQIDHVQSQINAIHADARQVREKARSWLQSSMAIADFIANNYRHEELTPGRLNDILRDIEISQRSIEQGAEQGAFSGALRAYHDLSDLRLELELKEQEWALWQNAALQDTKRLLEEARLNRQCQAIDLDGRPTGINCEVDYWTDGRLKDLEDKVEKIIGRLENSRLGLEELQEIVNETSPELRNQLEEIVLAARMALINSQLRFQRSEMIVDSLSAIGYDLEEGDYVGEDQRDAYVVKAVNAAGSEVVVIVEQDVEDQAKIDLEINRFHPTQVAEEIDVLATRELHEEIKGRGVQVSDPQMVASRPDEKVRDIRTISPRRKRS
jgi:hypothetical protein